MLSVLSMTRAACAVGLMLAAGAPAVAGMPEALKYVPSGTSAYVIVPDLGALIGNLSAMNQALAGKLPPDAAQLGMGLFFAQMVATQPGVTANGSAAVMFETDEDPPDPGVMAILPIEDLEAFAKGPFMSGQNATFNGDVLEAMSGQGEPVYMRDIGDFVVAGSIAEKVKAFKPGDWIGATRTALGDAGLRSVESGDLTLVVNIATFDEQITDMVENAEQQANFMAMMGGGDQVTQGFGLFKQAVDVIKRDGSVAVVSLDAGGEGVAMDLGVCFKGDSPSAAMFNAGGDTAPLVGALPQTDYLVAYAMDSSNQTLRDLFDTVVKMLPAQGGNDFGLKAMLGHASGVSGMIGSSPAALGGAGLFARGISYVRCDNPAETIGVMRSALEKLNGQTVDGMSYTTSYQPGSDEVEGVKVDTYAMQTQMDPNAGGGMGGMMDPAMIQNLLFGMAGGPNGYVAPVDGGFYTTMSKNTELLKSAFQAAKGGGSLTGNAMLAKVAPKLQENRIAEAYVSIDQIFNAFGPFAQMLGAMDAFEPMAAMPPIGFSLRGDDGAVLGRVYLDNDTIGTLSELAQKMESDDGMGGEGGDEPDPDF